MNTAKSELSKAYNSKVIDAKWYQFWLDNHFFKPVKNKEKPSFCIVIPPPNVTGALHMGHALTNTLQDILIRWKRMLGFETLWVPGTDHAGISTQTTVERHLIKTTGKKRKDFPREEFLSHVWQWKEQHEGRIISQLKKMGCSCDWDYLRFTLDDKNNKAVKTMFKKLYDEGLIYRGDYLVNWDPVTQTAIADDEVEYQENQSFLYHFKYPLSDKSGFIHFATTRPETMIGDTAIAVSPKDSRYTHLIGKTVDHPITGLAIPIVADHMVDPEFGTGCVKITPAHDPNDYQLGIKLKLPFINIMTPDGHINENGFEFAGLTMQEARLAVIEKMKLLNLFEKQVPHLNRVGVSYRSKAVIEPYMSKQWFVKMEQFGLVLKDIIKSGKTALTPKSWENSYFHWIDNLRDWCISRQLWWGHRIPIWYHKEDKDKIICYDGDDLPEEVKKNPEEWVQEEDVLDTWFSSGLWPFATLGWPEKTKELATFYPTSVLITGHDILFFWVARMLFMGHFALGEVPFKDVYLHGLIYGKSYWKELPEGGISYILGDDRKGLDEVAKLPKDVKSAWEKMSKTKGNIIDPIEIIEEYGTDAMRMALCSSGSQAREIDLDKRKFEEFRNFANKVWNGARFIFLNLDSEESPLTAEEFAKGLNFKIFKLEDHWILSLLNKVVKDVNQKLTNYQFDQAAIQAYDFFWKEFCAYYLEIAKPTLFGKVGSKDDRKNKQKILAIVLSQSIRLLHPITPFITEELFQELKLRLDAGLEVKNQDAFTKECMTALGCKACIVAPYPTNIEAPIQNVEKDFAAIEEIVYTIRNIRGEMKLPINVATDVNFIADKNDVDLQLLENNIQIVKALVKINELTINAPIDNTPSASSLYNNIKIVVPIPADLLAQEKMRLAKEQEKLKVMIEKMQVQLNNKDFTDRAPAQLIEKNRLQLEQALKELADINSKLGV